jgi:glycine hydroxymethyltransferase
MFSNKKRPYSTVFDPQISELVDAEENRQHETISLIPSENYASPMATELEGCAFTNKNAEGYPGRRFVAGCKFADQVEEIAIARLKEIFGCEHANVQGMSSTVANVALLQAFLKPGDTILSMSLAHGGHLSHGASFHLSGKLYDIVNYGVTKENETIDMQEVERLAKTHRPAMVICGTSSYPRLLDFRAFSEIAKSVDALLFADIAHTVGLIAAKAIPSPVPYADIITSSTHKTWRGPRGSAVVMSKKIWANKVDRAIFPGIQGAPKMDMIAARATLFAESMTMEFRDYTTQVLLNAQALAKSLSARGIRLVTGGTDTHLILADVHSLGISGAEAQSILESVNITTNRNPIPFDTLSASVGSGLRLGSPAMTTRGWVEEDFHSIAALLVRALTERSDDHILRDVRQQVGEMVSELPLFAPKWLPTCVRNLSQA